MGSFGIIHWLVLLLVIGLPVAAIVVLTNRKR